MGVPGPHGDDGKEAVLTSMTISYKYKLRIGKNLSTKSAHEPIPNLEFNYAILGLNSAHNLRRDTGEATSLDKVYVHHFTLLPINMLGAEVFGRDTSDPYMSLPGGTRYRCWQESNQTLIRISTFCRTKICL